MKRQSIILLLLVIVFMHPGCIHDQIIQNKKLIPVNDTRKTGRLLQQLPYGPIRFHLIYDT